MLEERHPLENLFTFGDGQFQQFLTEGRKEKFPFLQCIKIKKTPIFRKLISQQRQRQSQNNENNKNKDNIEPKTLRGKLISYHQAKNVRFSFEKEDLLKQYGKNSPSSLKKKRKISFPKAMRNIFPDLGPIPVQNRKISSAYPSMRYVGEDQQIKLSKNLSISSQRQELIRDVRPKSVMVLSSIISQGSEQKVKRIEHRKRVYRKINKQKIEQKKQQIGNNKMGWKINELKKLYC